MLGIVLRILCAITFNHDNGYFFFQMRNSGSDRENNLHKITQVAEGRAKTAQNGLTPGVCSYPL